MSAAAHTDVFSPEKRSAVMRAVKSGNTKPEMALRKALFALGYRYRLHDKRLPGRPDLVFHQHRTALFVHGCFWHGHNCKRGARTPKSNADYWIEKIRRNRERDAANKAALEADGWRVLIVWECEIPSLDPASLPIKRL
ncbi:MAG: very short patch repair endonuclease [Pseudomonadota bacterium]